MFRLAAFLIAWLLAAPAWAFLPGQPVGMLNPQVQPANAIAGLPAVDDNLGAGGYPVAGGICAEWGHQIPCNNHYSITRASTKYVSASDGLYASIPAGVFALGSNNGGSIEEARTNDALWSRDMTNAAWVTTTMTTALNAVGIDGTANSATTLTATGANAMVVQTITLASQADNYSVFLKRVTGSGVINLCLATTSCGTATACTVTRTIVFTRCTVTATVLNPVVGIQIVTNGDAVIADFNQMEPGSFPLSPILTTSATANRAADNVSPIGVLLAGLQSNAYAYVVKATNGNATSTQSYLFASAVGASWTSRANSGSNVSDILKTAQAQLVTGTVFSQGVAAKMAASFSLGSYAMSINGGAAGTSANAAALAQSGSAYVLGNSASSNNYLDGPVSRASFYPFAVSGSIVQALSALP